MHPCFFVCKEVDEFMYITCTIMFITLSIDSCIRVFDYMYMYVNFGLGDL